MEKRDAKDGKLDLPFQAFVNISALFLNVQYNLQTNTGAVRRKKMKQTEATCKDNIK